MQDAKADRNKVRLSLVPRKIIYAIARIRMYGNAKYPNGGINNWMTVEPWRYRDAAFRHFLAYLDDPYGTDEESGLPHLWHLACNIAFLTELEWGSYVDTTEERAPGAPARETTGIYGAEGDGQHEAVTVRYRADEA